MKIMHALVLFVALVASSCVTTTGTGPGATDLGGKAVNCTSSYVIGKAPDAYQKVSNILTSSDDFSTKKSALFDLAKNIATTGGLEIVSCLVRQYIADVTDSNRLGASNPATKQGAADGRTFLENVHVQFDDPAPSPGGALQPPAPPPN